MASDIAIQINNLGKCYHVYDKPRDRLKQLFYPGHRKFYREFWALQDITFQVKRGESFGIIGRNGSGKSTLLQLICQTLQPTVGDITVNGRVAALLELGAGFNPEFSGRENVYMNGAILGFSQQEMDNRFAAIAAFADIGSHIDLPVKTYSSGMFVRLAFAVQICVEPDILIVDEALSVGDIFFQQKCAKRMRELREKGTTLLFVSHDMAIVRDLCDNAIYLKQGKIAYMGDSTSTIRHYFKETSPTLPVQSPVVKTPVEKKLDNEFINLFKQKAFWVNESIKDNTNNILAVAIVDKQDNPVVKQTMGETVKFQILYKVVTSTPIHVTLTLKNRYDQVINSTGSYMEGLEPPLLEANDYAVFEIIMSCNIEAGFYTFAVTLGTSYDLPNRGIAVDETPWLGPLTIEWDYEHHKAPWLGMFGIPAASNFSNIKINKG